MQTFFFNYKNYDKVPEEIDVREERFALTPFSLWRRERETTRERGERIHKHSKREVQDIPFKDIHPVAFFLQVGQVSSGFDCFPRAPPAGGQISN